MSAIKKISNQNLRSLCDILGDTNNGLSGSEISRTLQDCSIPDVQPSITKRHRLFEALSQKQNEDRYANNVFAYLKYLLSPSRYLNNPALFEERRSQINEVLIFEGFSIEKNGEIIEKRAAQTIDEAKERAGRLRKILMERNVHHDVLRFCKAELLQENYFHAVFESTKSVADKIREKTGLDEDGSSLVDAAFGLGQANKPKLAFNTLQTSSEQSEHKGFMNLLKGVFGMFRNVPAHAPKINWTITEEDAIDCLTLTSFLHRKLDKCVSTGY